MLPQRPSQLLIMLVAEATMGYPQAIYRSVRHPVVWVGIALSLVVAGVAWLR